MSPQQLAKLKLQATLGATAIAGLVPLFTTKDPTLGVCIQKQLLAIPTTRWDEFVADYQTLKGGVGGAKYADMPEGLTLEIIDKVVAWLQQ